ncbi:uric acid degradation bifunctional protein TTL-like isoform X2 [Hibiscus syriacus]|uniref:uric acid degradation bifunctional protein TTL-like isoform X2 n=1 Tax=Hibiscus syriacus TaxID=106335 RepID=UPI001920E198|nr:uric acid degradation bifunctional protein TTL-like isoform X2 [Hibiscus syriacus]
MEEIKVDEKEVLACCGSTQFAKQMAMASPFPSLDHAISIAKDIWFNKVDIIGCLEAFAAHPQIGESPSSHTTSAQWSKGEQSTALATATDAGLQELSDWNARYRQKFGHVFLICSAGRSAAEILGELKNRYSNRPILELEIASQEQMKVTELRLRKLFSTKMKADSARSRYSSVVASKAEKRVGIIGQHLTATSEGFPAKAPQVQARTRPPITTHVLDVSKGCPAAGIEVRLEMWEGSQPHPSFGETDMGRWVLEGSSTTDRDGRSGQLMSIVDALVPGVYRINFNTGKYNPGGFFPYVSIVFEIKETQTLEHFHVPLLLSPFSFSTYRGS